MKLETPGLAGAHSNGDVTARRDAVAATPTA
jgi:hypothetical protein